MFSAAKIAASINRIQENTFDIATINMCTDLCPCVSGDNTTSWTDIDATYLADEYPDRVLPFHFRAPQSTGSDRLLTSHLTAETPEVGAQDDPEATGAEEEAAETGKDITVVEKFFDCYEKLNDEDKELKNLHPEAIEFIRAFEKKHDCSGFCKKGLFYWHRPLSEGRPG